MKKYIAIIAIIIGLGYTPAFAQAGRPKQEERAAKREEKRALKSNARLQKSDERKDKKLEHRLNSENEGKLVK